MIFTRPIYLLLADVGNQMFTRKQFGFSTKHKENIGSDHQANNISMSKPVRDVCRSNLDIHTWPDLCGSKLNACLDLCKSRADIYLYVQGIFQNHIILKKGFPIIFKKCLTVSEYSKSQLCNYLGSTYIYPRPANIHLISTLDLPWI